MATGEADCVHERLLLTCLAGLGVNVALTEEFLHHRHVVLLLHSGESGQHDGRVPGLVLLIHRAHTCREFMLSVVCQHFSARA